MSNKEILNSIDLLTNETDALSILESLDNPTFEEIENFAKKLSTLDPTASAYAETVLYSAGIYGDFSANDFARVMKQLDPEGIRIIDNTVAGKVLASKEYKRVLSDLFKYNGKEMLDYMRANESFSDSLKHNFKDLNLDTINVADDEIIKKLINSYEFSAVDGPWGKLSGRLVDSLEGSVTCVVPNAAEGRTWWLVEFPKLLANEKITTINGVSRDEWNRSVKYLKDVLGYSQEEALDLLKESSKFQANTLINSFSLDKVNLFYGKNADGWDVLKAIDTSEIDGKPFVGKIEGLTKRGIEEFYDGLANSELNKIYKSLAGMDLGNDRVLVYEIMRKYHEYDIGKYDIDPTTGKFKNYSNIEKYLETLKKYECLSMEDPTSKKGLKEIIKNMKINPTAIHILEGLGIAVDVFFLTKTINDMKSALAMGDTENAKKIGRDFIAENVGAAGGGALFIVILAFFASGSVSIPATLITGIAGGVLGGSFGKSISDWIGELLGEDPTITTLEGTSGNDRLFGRKGMDLIYGYGGDDILVGGTTAHYKDIDKRNDFLVGGEGNDLLLGGRGIDIYLFNVSEDSGNDLIVDTDKRGIIRLLKETIVPGTTLEELATSTQPGGISVSGTEETKEKKTIDINGTLIESDFTIMDSSGQKIKDFNGNLIRWELGRERNGQYGERGSYVTVIYTNDEGKENLVEN